MAFVVFSSVGLANPDEITRAHFEVACPIPRRFDLWSMDPYTGDCVGISEIFLERFCQFLMQRVKRRKWYLFKTLPHLFFLGSLAPTFLETVVDTYDS